MSDEKKLEELRGKILDAKLTQEFPRIGVIGATAPSFSYQTQDGLDVGYAIREFLDSHRGTVFTGGVEGIGSDVYAGVVKYCIRRGVATGTIPRDKFFAVIPNGIEYIPYGEDKVTTLPFEAPAMYGILASLINKEKLDVVRIGNNMLERRLGLASLADALVVVNGGPGTDHEAYTGLTLGKRVITLPYTGGTASLLESVKEGRWALPKKKLLVPKKKLIVPQKRPVKMFKLKERQPIMLGDSIKNLGPKPLDFNAVDHKLITIANSIDELVDELRKI